MSGNYSENNIKELTLNEAIRRRPGMYIGAVNNRGFIYMLKGILTDNLTSTKFSHVLLEFQGKNTAKIGFYYSERQIPDNWAIVSKDPVAPFLIDLKILNALSKEFLIRFFDLEGKEMLWQRFKKGELIGGEIESKILNCSAIEVEFRLDDEIWKDDFDWREDFIIHEIRDFAFMYRRTKFEVKYQFEGEPCRVIFHFKNGLKDKIEIEGLKGLGGCYFESSFEAQFDGFFIEAAFAFKKYTVDEPFLKSYVNDNFTHENGTHVDGLLNGLTYGVMRYFKKHKLTEAYKISEKGMRESLVAAINIRMDAAIFSGCVRNKLANPEIIEPIANYVADLLFRKIEEDEVATKKLIRDFKI